MSDNLCDPAIVRMIDRLMCARCGNCVPCCLCRASPERLAELRDELAREARRRRSPR